MCPSVPHLGYATEPSVGWIDRSLPVEASCTVSDLWASGFKPPENMGLGNKLVNLIDSPWITWSLIRGGTGGSDDWMAVGCTCVCPEVDCVIGCMCIGMRLPTVLITAGRLLVGASTWSKVAESSSSTSGCRCLRWVNYSTNYFG